MVCTEDWRSRVSLIWVIEDDASIRNGLVRALLLDGFDVQASDTVAGIAMLTGVPDLALLDVNLPDGDGFETCRALVQRFVSLRVIMLTARSDEIDVVVGLDSGAIDYITKPFRLAELKARIRAHIRRELSAPLIADSEDDVVTIGDVSIDVKRRRTWVAGIEVTLRVKEFDLLTRLMREPGRVVRRETLMTDVWDEHWSGSTKTLDVHVAALRKRFGETPEVPSRISTVRGVGFRFEEST
jgi:DNA-binding response OmpR family regulator